MGGPVDAGVVATGGTVGGGGVTDALLDLSPEPPLINTTITATIATAASAPPAIRRGRLPPRLPGVGGCGGGGGGGCWPVSPPGFELGAGVGAGARCAT